MSIRSAGLYFLLTFGTFSEGNAFAQDSSNDIQQSFPTNPNTEAAFNETGVLAQALEQELFSLGAPAHVRTLATALRVTLAGVRALPDVQGLHRAREQTEALELQLTLLGSFSHCRNLAQALTAKIAQAHAVVEAEGLAQEQAPIPDGDEPIYDGTGCITGDSCGQGSGLSLFR